ncbi:MAG TPA: hypothetical protein VGN32_10720, partial [Ktedonobacterales bacterium]|nr:hypothetical protein [Ktedonobacterales bacterium]
MDRDDEQKRQGANQSPLEIKRGARVVGPDGPVGALRQLIVSQDTGELRRLVVRGEAGLDFELPADHIASATGDEIRLTIGPRDLADHPDLARPFAPERYASREGNEFNYVEETSDPVAGGTTLTESRLYTLRITDLDAQPESGRALRQLAPLAVVGVLVGGAAGGLAYLLVRRRNAQVAQVATLMRASRLKAAWRPGMRATRARLSQLGSQDAARKASRAVSSALSDALGYANTALSDTLAYTNTLAIALSAAGRAWWASRSRVPRLRLRPQAAIAPISERIQKPVRAVRRTAAARRRGGRRF